MIKFIFFLVTAALGDDLKDFIFKQCRIITVHKGKIIVTKEITMLFQPHVTMLSTVNILLSITVSINEKTKLKIHTTTDHNMTTSVVR
jgi:hypothetical protein